MSVRKVNTRIIIPDAYYFNLTSKVYSRMGHNNKYFK